MDIVLDNFISCKLKDATMAFLDKLGIKYSIASESALPIDNLFKSISLSKATTEVLQNIQEAYFVASIDDRSFSGTSNASLEDAEKERYKGMFVFAVDVKPEANITRSVAAAITRAFNRRAKMNPVVLFLRKGDKLSIATCERSTYQQKGRTGEKVGKVSILRNIDCAAPHRGHINILESMQVPANCTNFDTLYEHWKKVFSSELLTKAFYNELADWYAWATMVMKFPNALEDATDDTKYNAENGIRLVTRLIFIWFLKEKKLIPEEFFDFNEVKKLIKDFNPSKKDGMFDQYVLDSKYYRAILQNLFFAMLNCPIFEDGNLLRGFRKYDADGKATNTGRGDSRLMRYKNYFSRPDVFVELSKKVPFLNGGLFDCLDDPDGKFYLDGFSENKDVLKALCVPDFLFFGEYNDIDLSEWYDDNQKKRIRVRGIIDILKSYQFTIEENTPYEQEVSLDPELLGKVFENLLASYNPETKTTARKSTGSYYTPREIVQYMVDESLVAYLKDKVDDKLENQYRQLLDYNDTEEEIALEDGQKKNIMDALYHCKVLDPACGSGAFPMGMLQQMVHIMSQLDDDNKIWKNVVEKKLKQELANTIDCDEEDRDELQNDINRNFDLSQNAPDYARKLYLIENCIYGVDIQTIAIQISKLRCFISLVVDQKVNDKAEDNYGIRPLPNLEARFVAANSLIGLNNDISLANTGEVQDIRNKLADANHRIFNVKTQKTKRKWKGKIVELRNELVAALRRTGFVTDDDASLIASWDQFNQNCSSRFFDPEWMFGFKKFDIVIGNPPYIDSETMVKVMPKERELYAKCFVIAKGNWDMYIPFYELGITSLNADGILSFITPNKWVSIGYGKKMRELYLKNFSQVCDCSSIKVFEAGNEPLICFFRAQETDSISLWRVHNDGFSHIDDVPKKKLNDNSLGMILSDELDLLIGICKAGKNVSDYSDSQNPFTTREAYELCTIINNNNNNNECLKLINTGTIDPYESLWGRKKTSYLKGKYDYPIVSKSIFAEKFPRRVKQTFPKLIITGMRYFEVYYDEDGKYIAGKSTIIIMQDNHSRDIMLFLLGVLNSKLIRFYINESYSTLGIDGGINFSTIIVDALPIPDATSNQQQLISIIVNGILTAKKSDPQADISTEKAMIDILVYLLYGLTYEEVMTVEESFCKPVENAEEVNTKKRKKKSASPTFKQLEIEEKIYTQWLDKYKKNGTLPSEEEMRKHIE